jgi:tetratricopeptide (TPR) repeat protein
MKKNITNLWWTIGLLSRNPNPYDSECYYNLGVCLGFLDRKAEAYDAFYKSAWSNAWKDSAYFSLAKIDMARGNLAEVLDHTRLSLEKNTESGKVYVIRAAAFRKSQDYAAAILTSKTAVEKDPFNLGALFELALVYGIIDEKEMATHYEHTLLKLSRADEQNLIEYAVDYANAGLPKEAFQILSYADRATGAGPMIYYHLGYFLQESGNQTEALAYFKKAVAAPSYLCFPNRLEEIKCLQAAIAANPSDSRANYYLGNLFYDKRQYDEAIQYWEIAAALDNSFPTVFRNLGIAYFNKQKNAAKALAAFETAFELDKTDSRVLMELRQLYKIENRDPKLRLDFIEANLTAAASRDDLYLERVTIYNVLGAYDKAYALIMSRKFHPWEGGEGKVSEQYIQSLIGLARADISEGAYLEAISKLTLAQEYPPNLGEGKLYGARENNIFYWLAIAYDGIGNQEMVRHFLIKAAEGNAELSAAIFYNDQQPDKIFYQGLALDKLGELEHSNAIFHKLVNYGYQHKDDRIKIDYFAVSLPNLMIFEDDLQLRNHIHCLFLQGLGYFGLKDYEMSGKMLHKVLTLNSDHLGARVHLDLINQSPDNTAVRL